MSTSPVFEFADLTDDGADGLFFAVPSFLNGDTAVFNAYGAGLLAPGNYFGRNWDGFFDTLMDLQWLQQETVTIYHASLPVFDGDGLTIYLECLRDAQQEWADDKTASFADDDNAFVAHKLRIGFAPALKEDVTGALG